MKLSKYRPSLPPPLALSSSSIGWFVSYSPLKHERAIHTLPKNQRKTPSFYQKIKVNDSKLYSHLRHLIHKRIPSILSSDELLQLKQILTLEKTYRDDPFIYPNWIFTKNNKTIHNLQTTSRPTADQVLFLLTISPSEWHRYLIYDVYPLYHSTEGFFG